jgi:CheY-like chemotaxis protein
VKRVVIMEDDDLIRATLTKSVRRLGYDVEDFSDAAPALESVDFSVVDLVITDLRMPMRGSIAIRILRDRGLNCPIIVVSGYVMPQDTAHLKALGATAVLRKPFGFQELASVVSQSLGTVAVPPSLN